MGARSIAAGLTVAFPLLLLACSDESSGGICSADALGEALASAGPGDTVTIGRCRISGAALTVPAGVTLAGESRDESILTAGQGENAVELTPGSTDATVVTGLTIESDGRFGVLASGQGQVRLTNLSVRATRGVAIVIDGVTEAELADVSLVGPVDRENVNTIPDSSEPGSHEVTAIAGLAIMDVATARLERVDVSGFASVGVLLDQSGASWTEGEVCGNRQLGLQIVGGSGTLENVRLCDTFHHEGLLTPAYAAVFAQGADVETNGLELSGSEGYGLLHDGAVSQNTDLVASGNSLAGVWVQNSTGFEVSGAGSAITDNRLAGIVVIESSNVAISDARIENTAALTRIPLGQSEGVRVGDGIHVVQSSDSIALTNLDLVNNERVGILVDLGGDSAADVVLTDIRVSGEGEQLGVIAQNATTPEGWDGDVERAGAVAANDASFDGTLPVLEGLVGPNDRPGDPDIDGLVGPND